MRSILLSISKLFLFAGTVIGGTSGLLMISSCTRVPAIENKLHIALSKLRNVDPIHAHSVEAAQVVSLAYESLYQYHPQRRPIEIMPLLAEGLPRISNDGLTYTIKIKKNVRFIDSEVFPGGKGRTVIAQDFIYSWKRIIDPSNTSEGFWIFDGRIKGVNDWRTRRSKNEVAFAEPIEGFQTPDDQTIVIKLIKPYPQLIYQLASPFSAVVASEAVEKYGATFNNHTVGTGPFTLAERRSDRLILIKNSKWHGETHLDESYLPEGIIFEEVKEPSTRWLKFMKGEFDYIDFAKDNFESSVNQQGELSAALKSKGMGLAMARDFELLYLGLNMLDPVLGKNGHVRQAMALALDGDAFVKAFFDRRGVPAQGVIPPGLDGYDANVKNAFRIYNLQKAKELLVKGGYPDGNGLPEFELVTGTTTTDRQMAEFIQQQESLLGIKIRVRQFSWPILLQRLSTKNCQLFIHAWSADYPDAENFLQLFYGPNANPGTNHTSYQSEKFDTLYRNSSKLAPGTRERTKLYQEMNAITMQDVPLIPLVWPTQTYIHHGWVRNLNPSLTVLNFSKYITLDLSKMREMREKL